MNRRLVCFGVLAVALVCTEGAAASKQGTTVWIGTIGCASRNAFCHVRRANVRLVVYGSAATATFGGFTEASHDSPTLRSRCALAYRLVAVRGAWSYYHATGKATYTTNTVENAPCRLDPYGALKTTRVGKKLRADFGMFQPSCARASADEKLYSPMDEYRAYLTRA